MIKVATIEFVNRDNADSSGVGRKFVGDNTLAFFNLQGCTKEELKEIIEYKSWVYSSYKCRHEKRYFVQPYGTGFDSEVVWCSAGFSSILIRYLQNKLGYIINGKELYRAKGIGGLPPMKFELWDFQRDAVQAWIDAGCYGIIKAPTASGKTVIVCHIIKRMDTRTLILVHTSDLLINVWFNYLVEMYGEGIKEKIGIIGGGLTKKDRKLMKIIGEGFNENIKKDIVIATSQSLLHKLYELGKERFGLLVVDEVHRHVAEYFKKVVSNVRTVYRCACSATLQRPDGLSPLFRGLIGNVVYRIGIRELVAKGLLVEPVFYSVIINDEDACLKIRNCNLKLLDYARFVKKTSASSKTKFDYIIDLCTRLKMEGRRFIIYTDFVNKEENENELSMFKLNNNEIYESGVYVRDDYVKALTERGFRVIGVTADMSSIGRQNIFNKLAKEELDGIVFGALGSEGINIPVVSAIIMCNATASNIRYAQRCGRAMRLYGIKKNCNIYEILINTPKELTWSIENFSEYVSEGFVKNRIFIDKLKIKE